MYCALTAKQWLLVNLGLPRKSKARLYWLRTGEDYRINTKSGVCEGPQKEAVVDPFMGFMVSGQG